MSQSKIVAQNVIGDFLRSLAFFFLPSVSWNVAVKPARLPKTGAEPKARGTARFIGRNGADPTKGAVRMYLEAAFQTPGLALPACIDAVAKAKHKMSTGSKGGKVPAALRQEIKEQAEKLVAEVPGFEAAAAFLILSQPKARGSQVKVTVSREGFESRTVNVPEKQVEGFLRLFDGVPGFTVTIGLPETVENPQSETIAA